MLFDLPSLYDLTAPELVALVDENVPFFPEQKSCLP